MRHTSLSNNWYLWDRAWELSGHKLGYCAIERCAATVPGHVHRDLLDGGVIGDPFVLARELGSQWVDEHAWTYGTEFEWTPSADTARRVLRFEGLDTVCAVSLNGQVIAKSNNMFVPLEVDVSALLATGKNTLEVRFESALRVGEQRLESYFQAEGLPADIERFESRSFVRKAQYMYGWDWGPKLVSAGIWRPVSLLEFSARLLSVRVRQTHREGGAVDLELTSEFEGEGRVVHVFDQTQVRFGDGALSVPEPKLWWPNGRGTAHLYELRTFLVPETCDVSALVKDGRAVLAEVERVALDERRTQIGLRTVRLRQEEDSFGRSFAFEINGQPLWAMGANWIPDHSLPSQVHTSALRARLEAACGAGFNMLRVWGGGLYETDEFYCLCDELGLLVWQDFPFACAYYPDSAPYADELALEAAVNIRRLRNHASLVLWCGNNENQQMYFARWGRPDHHPPRFYGQHLYNEVLPRVVAEHDPDRPYLPTSPYGGTDPNAGGIGDQHYWDVWHGRGDWVHYRDSTARFSSEYGFASSCSLAAWQLILDAKSSDERARVAEHPVRSQIVRWHDKTGKGQDTFLGFVSLHYPESERLEDWVYYSQLNQRDAIRTAIEHYRRSEFCKGSLIWQLNDCWPVQSWALIDSLENPKPAFYELKRLHAPGLVSIEVEDDVVSVWGILDNTDGAMSLRGSVTLEAFALSSGERLWQQSSDATVAAGARKVILKAALPPLEKTQTLLVAGFAGYVASRLLAEPKELKLPKAAPISVKRVSPEEIEVSCETPLVDLVLTDGGSTKPFRNNVFTRATPGSFRLAYDGDCEHLSARSLSGHHELRVLAGL